MRYASTVLLAGLLGCGNAALMTNPDEGDPSERAIEGHACEPERSLQFQIVAHAATLTRGLPRTSLESGVSLPEFDAAPFGLTVAEGEEVVALILAHAAQRLSPFGIEVIGDAEPASIDPSAEIIARVILTQVNGVPEHCGCQGSTGGLGLPSDGPAEGAVFANAFVENGLAGALARYSREERVTRLAAALANSVLHEAGHTLGLVHLDVPGQPTLLMARGGSASARVSLAAATTLQAFSTEELEVTADALDVRSTQCDTCVIEQALAARRLCQPDPQP